MHRRTRTIRRTSYVLYGLFVAALLAGCVPGTVAMLGPEREFPGLAGDLADARSAGQPLHVVLIHGMSHGDPSQPQTLGDSRAAEDVRRLARALGYDVPPEITPTCMATVRSVRRYTFDIEQIVSGAGTAPSLVFHEVDFTRYLGFEESPYPDLVVARREKIELDSNDDVLVGSGAYYNQRLKEEVVTWGLADAATYLDRDKRDVITLAVADALFGIFETVAGPAPAPDAEEPVAPSCDAYAPDRSKDEPVKVSFITKSLGSKVLFDTLARAYGIQPDVGVAERVPLFKGTQAIYMLANQLPLLELGTESDARFDWSTLWGALETRQAEAPDELYLVAFSDPNDLLSFRIGPTVDTYGSPETTLHAVDVSVPIASNWLGLFAWPVTAHMGHLTNDHVLRLLVHGNGANP